MPSKASSMVEFCESNTKSVDTAILYHGSAMPDLTELRPSTRGIFGSGLYLTSSLRNAEAYARSRSEYMDNKAAASHGTVYINELKGASMLDCSGVGGEKLEEVLKSSTIQTALSELAQDPKTPRFETKAIEDFLKRSEETSSGSWRAAAFRFLGFDGLIIDGEIWLITNVRKVKVISKIGLSELWKVRENATESALCRVLKAPEEAFDRALSIAMCVPHMTRLDSAIAIATTAPLKLVFVPVHYLDLGVHKLLDKRFDREFISS